MGRPASRTTAFPAPETPSLSFTMTLSMVGRWARMATTASARSSSVRRSSTPSGWGTPTSAKSRRQPVLEPSGASRGSAPYIGMPRESATSRSSSVVLYGIMCERAGLGTNAAILASSRGRSSSFSLSDRGEESCTATSVSRARAWLGITPGSRAR